MSKLRRRRKYERQMAEVRKLIAKVQNNMDRYKPKPTTLPLPPTRQEEIAAQRFREMISDPSYLQQMEETHAVLAEHGKWLEQFNHDLTTFTLNSYRSDHGHLPAGKANTKRLRKKRERLIHLDADPKSTARRRRIERVKYEYELRNY